MPPLRGKRGSKCPCLSYLTPTQIDQLNEVSSMKQEVVTIGAGGKLSFTRAAYVSVSIRFEDYWALSGRPADVSSP
jgi:hypothetical protein